MYSYRKLMEAQQREWPNSVRLSVGQMMDWANNAPDRQTAQIRKEMMLCTMHHPRVLFYKTEHGHIGARYGLRPEQYLSGFNFRAVELVEGQLVDTARVVF